MDRVKNSGAAIVSAFEINGRAMLPGSLAGVVAASADRDCPREEYRVDELDSKKVFRASPYPRDIPGVPCERNFNGVSFAAAGCLRHD